MAIDEKNTTVTIVGAGGKMGLRILNNMVKTTSNCCFVRCQRRESRRSRKRIYR